MLEKVVTLYRKAEMGLVSGLSGATAKVIEETRFYDIGYMQTQISRIQKELRNIENEVKTSLEIQDNSDYGKNRRSELMKQREMLLFRMIFLASNSFKNLDDCVKMADGHNFEFMQCVQGLLEYRAGHRDNAFKMLEAYYQEHGSVKGHFLVNKVSGLLLAEKRLYQKAASFLTYALQFVPDDSEALGALRSCYRQMGETERCGVIEDILTVLGDSEVYAWNVQHLSI